MIHSPLNDREKSFAKQGTIENGQGTILEVAASCLFALNGLEQRFEIAFAEALCAFALDDLEE
jgi:hypothetical protein